MPYTNPQLAKLCREKKIPVVTSKQGANYVAIRMLEKPWEIDLILLTDNLEPMFVITYYVN